MVVTAVNGLMSAKTLDLGKNFIEKDGTMITAFEPVMVLTVEWHVVGKFL
jgi:hypothetical protein